MKGFFFHLHRGHFPLYDSSFTEQPPKTPYISCYYFHIPKLSKFLFQINFIQCIKSFKLFAKNGCGCGEEETLCLYGGDCVPKAKGCDGHPDCPDKSDEWGCLQILNSRIQIK